MTPWVLPHARVGVVANPKAGAGEDVVRETVCRAVDAVARARSSWRIVLLRGGFSARAAASTDAAQVELVKGSTLESVPSAGSAARSLLAAGVDALIGIGGDGTLADIASVIIDSGRPIPLLGIGVGSSNVGPLIRVHGTALTAERLAELDVASVHGIEAFCDGVRLGIAFNDVAFSNLYFGTRSGRRVDLDAAAHLRGEDRSTKPRSVCRETTFVEKNGRTVIDGKLHRLAQIVASPLNLDECSVYAGKAVSGLMSWGPYLGRPAVLAGISDVAIRTQVDDQILADVEPLHLYHVCFGPDDTISVGGLDPSAVLVLDGNGVRQLAFGESVALKLRCNALRVLHTPGSRPGEASQLL